MSKDFQLSDELMEKIDQIHSSPGKLADIIFSTYLKGHNLTTHELTAFAIQWLGIVSQGDYSFLAASAKEAGKLFYTAHYYTLWDKHVRENAVQEDTKDEPGPDIPDTKVNTGIIH